MKFINFTSKMILYLKKLNFKVSTRGLNFIKLKNKSSYVVNLFDEEKYISSRFLPTEIEKEIKDYPKLLSVRVDNLDYYFYGKNQDSKYLLKIIKSLSMVNNYLKEETKNSSKIIKIIIYLSPFKKEFTGDYIKPININSGLTQNQEKIFIFREEEWTKVLIHELIHAYAFDNYKFIKNSLIIGDDYPYEAITEFYAILLHSNWLSIISGLDYKNILKNEIKFSIFQSLKLLKYLKITSRKQFINFGKLEIKMESSAFSYYLLKTEFLLHFCSYKEELLKKELPWGKNIDAFYLPKDELNKFKILKYLKFIPKLEFDTNARMSLFQIKSTGIKG